jgi:tripartite-type tricarboxylate transporter receptor subunit TctC
VKGGSNVKLPRRNFLHLAAGAVALPAVSRIAWAQAYPTRPVRLIVGFAPGGADIEPVTSFASGALVMVVNPSVPAKTVPEFIAYAKANPGRISMASQGVGGTGHVSGELFKMMAGVNLVHVPYRGAGPALVDLLGGQVQVMFAATASSIEYIRAGRLRALAVTAATRSEALIAANRARQQR